MKALIHRWPRGLLATAVVLALAAAAVGQVITGTILGTVRDESGAVLPGATVTLSSEELPGGPLVATTRENGQFRFPNLPPGLYTLEVQLPGFATYHEEGLRVVVGGNVERIVTMKLAAVAETVTVTGESPVVDTRKSGVSTNFSKEYYENVPIRRFSFFDFTKTAPGMSATRPTARDSSRVSAFGTPVDSSAYLMDGTDFTAPWSGAAWPWPDTDVVEEMEILSLGASAEYGNIQGAVFNVVTKQGTNEFRFDTAFFYQNQDLTSTPIELDCGDCPGGTSGFTRDRYNDFTIHAGGPIAKDKAWIYGGYQYLRDFDAQPGADPRFPEKFKADRIFWKFTWQITDRLKFMHTYHDDYWEDPQSPSVSDPFETTVNFGGHNPSTTMGLITHILSDNTFYEARLSGFYSPNDFCEPQSGSRTLPWHYDVGTGIASGGSFGFCSFHQNRTEGKAKLSHYASDWLGAEHDFKFGVQYTYGQADGVYGYPGGIHYYDYYGEPYYAYLREPYSYGGQFRNIGLFAEDVVTVNDRLTLNLGVRFDRNKAVSPDLPARDAEGNKIAGTIEGLGDLYTWKVVSPRLGLNAKLTADGRTVLRASYGRFHRAILTREIDQVHPGITPLTLAFFDPATGGFTDIVSVEDPNINLRIDPDTKAPYTDQFSIGIDREVSANTAFSVTYVHTESRRTIGWTDIGGVYGTDTAVLDDGRTITVHPLLNSTEERLFLLTNPDGWESDYDGVVLAFNKRWSDRWQAMVSYTWSRAEGILASSNLPVGAFSSGSSAGSFDLGKDPNDLTNLLGTNAKLPNDRTHMFRLTGAYEIPGIDVMIAGNYRYDTGLPWAAQARVPLPQGPRNIFLEPLGARRLSPQHNLDFRASKIWHYGRNGKVEVIFDFLNILNEDAEESLITQNFFSPNFGLPDDFIDPRRIMIGVKFAY